VVIRQVMHEKVKKCVGKGANSAHIGRRFALIGVTGELDALPIDAFEGGGALELRGRRCHEHESDGRLHAQADFIALADPSVGHQIPKKLH
jgi:hypothetical protein